MRMSSAGEASRHERGFTLLELMVVLAIVATIATHALPHLPGLASGPELRRDAEELRADLRRARAFALDRGLPNVLLIDVAEGRWSDLTGRARGAVRGETRLSLVIAAPERVDPEAGGIRFFPDGTSTGGTVTLRRGDEVVAVKVDWFDGGIRVGRPRAD